MASTTAVTPLARASLCRCPNNPNPVTSVAQTAFASSAAAAASRFNWVIAATACGNGSPVALCRLFSTPMPSGLVRVNGSPGRPASLRSKRSGSATPVTAMPYLGSGSSTLWPPATWQPACRATSNPPRSTSAASSIGSTSRGQPSRLTATTGVPPMAYTSESAFVAAIRPQSYASSTTGVKKSTVATIAVPDSSRTTAASSPSSSPTSSSPGPAGGCGPARPATTDSSSPGGILQAQPPPWAYCVSRYVGILATLTG